MHTARKAVFAIIFLGCALANLLETQACARARQVNESAKIEAINGPYPPIVYETGDPRSRVGGDPGVPFRLVMFGAIRPTAVIDWRIIGHTVVLRMSTSAANNPPLLYFNGVGVSKLLAYVDNNLFPIAASNIYSYDSVYFGCAFFTRFRALSFDSGRAMGVDRDDVADIFVSGPACTHSPNIQTLTNQPAKPTISFPYGGLILKSSRARFHAINAMAWKDLLTQVHEVSEDDVLLFKTRSGRIVKMLPGASMIELDGPYAITGQTGKFFDSR